MGFEGIQIAGFELSHLVAILMLLGCALFLLYWFWVFPCGSDSQEETTLLPGDRQGRVVSGQEMTSSTSGGGKVKEVVLYAMEIEPGTVVLQSQTGDLFRVLREYDSVSTTGAPCPALPPATSVPVHYIPAYTRAHLQNQPSAPPYSVVGEAEHGQGSQEPWRPLCVQSGPGY